MGNNLAEQQGNNNKAKTNQQTQEQLSSPLSQVLKTYDFGNFIYKALYGLESSGLRWSQRLHDIILQL